MSRKADHEIKFETGLARLEDLIQDLESGTLDLDKSLAVFEEGVKLSRLLNQKLDEAEKKLELLLKNDLGQPQTRELLLEPEEQKAD